MIRTVSVRIVCSSTTRRSLLTTRCATMAVWMTVPAALNKQRASAVTFPAGATSEDEVRSRAIKS